MSPEVRALLARRFIEEAERETQEERRRPLLEEARFHAELVPDPELKADLIAIIDAESPPAIVAAEIPVAEEPPVAQKVEYEGPVRGVKLVGEPLLVKIQREPPDQPPTDRLLSSQKGQDNPEIIPFNSPNNREYDSDLLLSDIRGQGDAVDMIERSIIKPQVFPLLFGGSPGMTGILLYGVPGGGKSTVAVATGNSLNNIPGLNRRYRSREETLALINNPKLPGWAIRHFSVDPNQCSADDGCVLLENGQKAVRVPRVILFNIRSGEDIESKWLGEAPRKLGRLFEMADEVAPSMLFIDEAEEAFNNVPAPEGHSGATVNAFKQYFGGVGSSKKSITVMMATNFVGRMASAVLSRFGRFTREISLPDAASRHQIIQRAISKQLLRYRLERSKEAQIEAAERREQAALRVNAWLDDWPAVVRWLVEKTRPPLSIAEFEGGRRGFWSARDIDNYVAEAFDLRRDAISTGRACLCPVVVAEGEKSPCDVVEKPPGIVKFYVPCPRGYVGESVEAEQVRDRLLPGLFTQQDFEQVDYSPTTSPSDIKDQLLFNRQRGLPIPTPNTPEGNVQDLVDYYVNDQKPTAERGMFGANTTVPIT